MGSQNLLQPNFQTSGYTAPAKKTFILKALGACQNGGVDVDGAERLSDRWHRSPPRFEECAACILHQMPAIGDLSRFRQRPSDRLTYPLPRSRDTTPMLRRAESQAATVAASRSGRTSMLCRSRSEMIVPRLHAHSSIPTTCGVGDEPDEWERTARSTVFLPTGNKSRRARLCPGRPPTPDRDKGQSAAGVSAAPVCSAISSQAVRRRSFPGNSSLHIGIAEPPR
jgi:hypothetical protein